MCACVFSPFIYTYSNLTVLVFGESIFTDYIYAAYDTFMLHQIDMLQKKVFAQSRNLT